MQTALPGLAPNPYQLEPLRPSYAKMCRQIEAIAKAATKPVDALTAADLASHAATRGWKPATLATLTRVAHAHGLDVDPHTSPRPRPRPAGISLSTYTATGPDSPAGQQRCAALAALIWRCPAPLHFWRQHTFADLPVAGDTVHVNDRACHGAGHPYLTWRDTARRLHPDIPDNRLPFLARLDDSLLAAGERAIEIDWATWMDGITIDRWRAWAIDAGNPAHSRGSDRHRHR